MGSANQFLSPSQAASRLGVSVKALRLYERHGLITPVRTAAGWRTYGPDQMDRAAEIVSLRALGLSLAQIARVIQGDPSGLEAALAAHQTVLDDRLLQLTGMIEKLRNLRDGLARGLAPTSAELASLMAADGALNVAFDLPWPWGGEPFELRHVRKLNYITGPLGSGKTRLARHIAQSLLSAAFLGLDRLADGGADAQARMEADRELKSRVEQRLAWLIEDGAEPSTALITLLAALESDASMILVIDMIEQQLNLASQEALMAYLRGRGPGSVPLFMLTRSSAILDLQAIEADETIIFCPANHSPPICVAPHPGARGYEALTSCLATPQIRARTNGVVAMRLDPRQEASHFREAFPSFSSLTGCK